MRHSDRTGRRSDAGAASSSACHLRVIEQEIELRAKPAALRYRQQRQHPAEAGGEGVLRRRLARALARRGGALPHDMGSGAEPGGQVDKTMLDAAEPVDDQLDQRRRQLIPRHHRHHGGTQAPDDGDETLRRGAGRGWGV